LKAGKTNAARMNREQHDGFLASVPAPTKKQIMPNALLNGVKLLAKISEERT
jgi:hypothetical protein